MINYLSKPDLNSVNEPPIYRGLAIIKPKSTNFKVKAETGIAFKAVAELMDIDSQMLLETLMEEYVSSVRDSIGEVAMRYPAFRAKYPFVEQSSTRT
jgi:hypothetical protein